MSLPPWRLLLIAISGTAVIAKSTSTSPIVERCPGLKDASHVACVYHYAAAFPQPFTRASAADGRDPENDTFIDTSVPADPSFDHPPHHTPPTIANYTTDPPVYAVNGGKLYKGKIYWASEASFPFPDPRTGKTILQTPGIYELDPYTGKVTTLVNNYNGTQLNSPNDLFIDNVGDIFFTDSWYGYAINVTQYPVHAPATYRFRPSTGALSITENMLQQPNGIGISPDGKTMYITDTGVTKFRGAPKDILPRYTYNPFGGKVVYAYDIYPSPPGSYITNKRPIWLAETFADDGFHVSKEGYLLGAAGTD